MEQHHPDTPADHSDPKPRMLTEKQIQEFLSRVAKEMQLRAQRDQPEAQRSTTRKLQAKRPQQYGSLALRRLRGGR